jgi:ribosomal protein L34
MKALIYRPPFENARAAGWLNRLSGRSGAYVIRSRRSGRVLYVGESHTGRLATTVKRHFWAWPDDAERPHHVYRAAGCEVAVRITPPGSAIGAQGNLIRRLRPRDNRIGGEVRQPF